MDGNEGRDTRRREMMSEIRVFLLTPEGISFKRDMDTLKEDILLRISSSNNDLSVAQELADLTTLGGKQCGWKQRYLYMILFYELHLILRMRDAIVAMGYSGKLLGNITIMETYPEGFVYRTNVSLFEKLKEMYS